MGGDVHFLPIEFYCYSNVYVSFVHNVLEVFRMIYILHMLFLFLYKKYLYLLK